MKKSFISLVAFVLMLVVFTACTNGSKLPKGIEWKDEAVTANLGDKFTLMGEAITDDDGKVYSIQATVANAKTGATVNVISNQFSVDSMDGYKIIYTLVLSEDKKIDRTVTITVKDAEKPVLSIDETFLLVEAGKEFELPKINVFDKSGEKLTAKVEIFKIDGETRTKIEFSDGKYKLDQQGQYVMVATATDSSGNTGKAERIFYADKIETGEIEGFKTSASVANIAAHGTGRAGPALNVGYSSDFKRLPNSTGAAFMSTESVSGGHLYPNFFVSPRIDKQAFVNAISEPGYYISVWLYMDDTSLDARNICFKNNIVRTNAPTSQWVNVKISFDDIKSEKGQDKTYFQSWSEFYDALVSKEESLFWVNNPNNAVFNVYVDSIFIAKDVTFDFDMEIEYEVGTPIDLVTDFDHSLIYLISYGGKLELVTSDTFTSDIIGSVVVTAIPVDNRYVGSAQCEFEVTGSARLEFESNSGVTYRKGQDNPLPQAKLYEKSDNSLITDTEIIYSIALESTGETVTIKDNTFNPTATGVYVVTAETEYDGYKVTSRLLITVERVAAVAGEIDHFEDPSSKLNVVPSAGNVIHHESILGANGVLQISAENPWPSFNFVPRQDKTDYENYDFIVFRMYIEGGLKYLKLLNSDKTEGYTDDFGALYKDTWHDYVLPIDNFLRFFDDIKSGDEKGKVWGESDGAYTIYIDSIYVKTYEFNSYIQLSTTDGKPYLTNNDYDFPSAQLYKSRGNTLIEDAEFSYKLVDKDGNDVELAGGKLRLSAVGEYTLTITAVNDGQTITTSLLINAVDEMPNKLDIVDITGVDSLSALGKSQATLTYLAEYEGEQNVIKMYSESAWPNFYFEPRFDKEAYEGYRYIVFRMYINDPDGYPNQYGFQLDVGGHFGTIQSGMWHDYVVSAEDFLAQFDTFKGADRSGHVWIDNPDNKPFTFYLSSIWMTNTSDKAYIMDFDVKAQLDQIKTESIYSSRIMPESRGETTVAELYYKEPITLNIVPQSDASTYAGMTKLVFRMFVNTNEYLKSFSFHYGTTSVEIFNKDNVTFREWINYEITITENLEDFNSFLNGEVLGSCSGDFAEEMTGDDYYFRISAIWAE